MFGGKPSAAFQSDAGPDPGVTEIFQASSEFKGTPMKFKPVDWTDTIVRYGRDVNISTKLVCITAMSTYRGKSLEELRAEDYECSKVHVYRNPLHPDVTQGVLLDPKLLAATTSSNSDAPGNSFKVLPSSNSSTTVQPWPQKPVPSFGTSPHLATATSLSALTSGATSAVDSLVPAIAAFSQPLTLGGFSFKPASASKPFVTSRKTTKASVFSGFRFGKTLESASANTIGATLIASASAPFSVRSSSVSASYSAPTTVSTFTLAPPLTSSVSTGLFSASSSTVDRTPVSPFGGGKGSPNPILGFGNMLQPHGSASAGASSAPQREDEMFSKPVASESVSRLDSTIKQGLVEVKTAIERLTDTFEKSMCPKQKTPFDAGNSRRGGEKEMETDMSEAPKQTPGVPLSCDMSSSDSAIRSSFDQSTSLELKEECQIEASAKQISEEYTLSGEASRQDKSEIQSVSLADVFELVRALKTANCSADDIASLVYLAREMKQADVTVQDLADMKDYFQKPF